ncbi:MAG: hypothetical protein ACK2UK_14580 [Candidatus Promineifilaceae bacterium]
MTEKRWLVLILCLYLLLGFAYAIATPPFEASDELWHYPMVRHLADGNPLPVQVLDPALAGPWKQEASQPPLYYYLGAALTFWIDTTDMDLVRHENPHVDNGLITSDGNTNLVVHDPAANPWQGTLLAVRLVRFMSVLLGAVTVYLTYRIGGAAVSGRSEIALGAAAVNAFLPMFLFISGAVNNDNLAILLASLSLALMIAIVHAAKIVSTGEAASPVWQEWGQWLVLGAVIGLALLTKEGTIGLLPLAWGTAFVVAWMHVSRRRPSRPESVMPLREVWTALWHSAAAFLLVLLPVLLIAGWWYWRNIQLYGDWLGWSAFIAVLGERAHPASLIQLWGERRGFLMAYWGLFGGVNIPMPAWVYFIFNTLLLIAVPGFVVFVIREIRAWVHASSYRWRRLSDWFNNLMGLVAEYFALVASFLFATGVVIGLIRWATTTWSSQGRLVFTALSALTTLFVIGLVGWMPQRAARWTIAFIGGFFFVIAAAAPVLWIMPAYELSAYDLARGATFTDMDLALDNTVRIYAAAVDLEEGSEPRPGDAFWVHLDWEPLVKMNRDWSLFVHAVDPVLGQPIAQRDMYPGQGLLLASWLEPGERIISSFRVQIPETAVAPADLEIVAGFYDVTSGERMSTGLPDDVIPLADLLLMPAEGTYPNAVRINFEDQFLLQGYTVAPRAIEAGGTIELTLHWQPLRQPDKNYTFFSQVVDENTTRWAAVDYTPPEGTQNWTAGEPVDMPMTLSLSTETPAGVYPLIVGIYTQDDDGEFDRLQVKTVDGRLTDDFVRLTAIRVQP